jgi:hypothetical protein
MNLFKLCLLPALITLLSSCSSVETVDMAHYAAEVGGVGFSLAHPQSWVVEANANSVKLASDASLLTAVQINEGAVIRVIVLPTAMLVSDDLMVLMSAEVNNLQAFSGAIIRDAATAVTTNGQEGYTAVFDSLDRTNVIRLTVIQAEQSVAIGVGYIASAEEETLAPVVEQVLNSIEMELLIE